MISRMNAFATSVGRCSAPDWQAVLRKQNPIYHLDVVITSASESTAFVLSTSQMDTVSTANVV